MASKPSGFLPNPNNLVEYDPSDSSVVSHARLTHLPPAAWKGFFLVALKRLEKCKPGWARLAQRELVDFYHTWVFCGFNRDTPRELRWMVEAFQYMERRDLGRGKIKPEEDPAAYWLIAKYEQLRRALAALKRQHRELRSPPKDFWRTGLQRILREVGPVYPRGSNKLAAKIVTVRMVEAAHFEAASDAAFTIIGELWRVSPNYLKKAFVAVRRSRDPLRLWPRALANPPAKK